jgi:hypothetical protein
MAHDVLHGVTMETVSTASRTNQRLPHLRRRVRSDTPLLASSLRWRWICVATAALWTIIIAIVVFRYHVGNLDGTTGSLVIPVDATLYEHGQGAAMFIILAPACAVAVGLFDLVARTRQRRGAPGVAAIAIGGCVTAFSLFGLLWGLASVGVVGALIVLSGQAMKSALPAEHT